MTKDNEQYAYLTVVGEFTPETITELLGLKPSEAWIKGYLNEKTHLERKFSRWSLHSRLERSASLENHVRDVLEQVLPKTEQIRRIGTEYQVGVQLVATVVSWNRQFRQRAATPIGNTVGSSLSTSPPNRVNSCGVNPSKFICSRQPFLLSFTEVTKPDP